MEIDPKELKIETFRAAGLGLTYNCTGIRLTHVPTGTVITKYSEKHYDQNRDLALEELKKRLEEK